MHPVGRVLGNTAGAAVGGVMGSPMPLKHLPTRCFLSPFLSARISMLRHAAAPEAVHRAQGLSALAAPVRFKHAACATACPAASSTGTSSDTIGSVAQGEKSENDFHIDPRRLPSTIPGMTQEELAARIEQYHSQESKIAEEMSTKALAREVELMRRSMAPDAFKVYMKQLEKDQRAASKEEAKMAAMSPAELHRYNQKKRRQAMRYEWYKTIMLCVAVLGSTAFLFGLFFFFE